jgi:hypothetical protein
MVLVDDDMNAASIIMYMETGSSVPSLDERKLEPGAPETSNALRRRIHDSIDFSSDPWTAFSGFLSEALEVRRRQLKNRVHEPISMT